MIQPKISIIIVTWNGEAYIEKCLQSIFNQDLSKISGVDPNSFFDLLLIDNNSGDSPLSIIEENITPNLKIVKNKLNIGFAKAYNQVELLKDPTAHAEMIAITQAANSLSAKWLADCCMYVTIEPCSMCAGALVLARIKRLCFGAFDDKAGACGSIINIASNSKLNHKMELISGICAAECGELMTDFFKKKRLAAKK